MATHSPNFSGMNRLKAALGRSVSPASLSVFRFGFGAIMVWYLAKLIWPKAGKTKLAFQYLEPDWNCAFVGLEWIQPWPEPFLTFHVWIMIVAAIGIALGCLYRVCSTVFFAGYTYLFLLESADYNNHYYLICLIAFLLIFMPANRAYSIDAWWKHRRIDRTKLPESGNQIPFWPVFLLRFQLFVVYFFGGIAKFNADWLTGLPLLSPASTMHESLSSTGLLPEAIGVQHVALFLAWGGLIFDLSIGFLLLHRRTRLLGVVGLFIFHFTNNLLFTIGIFPVLAFTATLIFFPPDWPVQVFRWFRKPSWNWRVLFGFASVAKTNQELSSPTLRPGLQAFLLIWIVFQIGFPLRHFMIPHDANWTEEGQRFAWRMMLRMKAPGHIVYYVEDNQLVKQRDNIDVIDWAQWPYERKHEIYVPIMSSHFSWDQHIGMTILYEPCLGYRIIYGVEGDPKVAEQRIRETWQSAFGREPASIVKTRDIKSAVSLMRNSVSPDHSKIHQLLGEVERLESDRPTRSNWPTESRRQMALTDAVERLLGSDEPSASALRSIHPFALQGAAMPNRTLLAIQDPLLTSECPANLIRITNGSAYVIWLDLEQMRPRDWRRLPQQFVTYQKGDLQIIWNHFRELNWQQTERLANRPHMIWQYAQHIGDEWSTAIGRKPAVRASTSVILNYRAPSPIVDPECDLTRVKYHLLGHNDWITQVESDIPSWAEFQSIKQKRVAQRIK